MSFNYAPHRRRQSNTIARRLPRWSPAILAFAAFVTVVVLTGGSSRPDISWLLILRPVAVVCIVIMLLTSHFDWRGIRPLPLLLLAFATTIGIQLVPLPPALWYGLSGRETYDAVAQALNGTRLWHPLAIAPDRAWNSLLALLVPLGCMIGFSALSDRQRRLLLWPILAIVAFSMVLGLAQIASGGSSPLYWYKVSGRGQLIGLLANRNHQGALLALALPLLRAWMLSSDLRGPANQRVTIGLSSMAVIIVYILVLGSRAGLFLMLLGLVAAFLVRPSLATGKISKGERWLVIGGISAAIILLVAIALTAGRAVSVGRIVDGDLSTEGRIAALPTLFHIMTQSLPFGTGFGSFVPVYASYEPDALLHTSYFNNAHNDLIELTITGGIPALTVFAMFLIWWLRASFRAISTTAHRPWCALQRASAFAILILLLASLVDYPLRTPLLGAVFTILCCWLAHAPATGTPQKDV